MEEINEGATGGVREKNGTKHETENQGVNKNTKNSAPRRERSSLPGEEQGKNELMEDLVTMFKNMITKVLTREGSDTEEVLERMKKNLIEFQETEQGNIDEPKYAIYNVKRDSSEGSEYDGHRERSDSSIGESGKEGEKKSRRRTKRNRRVKENKREDSFSDSEVERVRRRYKRRNGKRNAKKTQEDTVGTYDEWMVTEEEEGSVVMSDSEENSLNRREQKPKMRNSRRGKVIQDKEILYDDWTQKMTEIIKLIQKGNNKSVPEPEIYDVNSGKSFKKFLEKFERYCRSKYSNNEEDWVYVLGDFLKGEMKNIYRPARDNERSYRYIKNRLEKWYVMKRKNMEMDRKQEFQDAEMKKNETVVSYMFRLEDLAQAAFPNIEIKNNKELRKKFMRTAPPAFIAHVKENSWLRYRLGGRNFSWEEVKEMASFREENKTTKSSRGQESSWSGSEDLEVANIIVRDEGRKKNPEDRTYNDRNRGFKRDSRIHERSSTPNRGPNIVCRWCKLRGHMERECWRKSGACLACGQQGHFARECQVKPLDQSYQQRGSTSYSKIGRQNNNYNTNYGRNNNTERLNQRRNNGRVDYNEFRGRRGWNNRGYHYNRGGFRNYDYNYGYDNYDRRDAYSDHRKNQNRRDGPNNQETRRDGPNREPRGEETNNISGNRQQDQLN